MAHLTDKPYIDNSNILLLLNDLACEIQRCYGTMGAYVDVLVVGGGALAIKHGFRNTVDIDADIRFSGNITMCINNVANYRNIPKDWINQDFMKSYSYSRYLWNNAILVTTIQGFLRVYVVSDLDQLCMKSTAGRRKDIRDIDLLLSVLIPEGVRFSDFEYEYNMLYKGTVKVNGKAYDRIRRTFKKANQL